MTNGTTASGKDRIPPVTCPYCDGSAVLADDGAVSTKTPSGLIWLCRHCDAWVGTHENSSTHRPLGRLANESLRKLRVRARYLFGQFIRVDARHNGCSVTKSRDRAHCWFAPQMGIEAWEFNIWSFDDAQTQRVIDICESMSSRVRKEAA